MVELSVNSSSWFVPEPLTGLARLGQSRDLLRKLPFGIRRLEAGRYGSS